MILFSLAEGWRNFKNFSLIGFLSVISLTITLIILGLSIHGILVLKGWQDGLLGKFQMEVFLDGDLSEGRIDTIAGELQTLAKIDSLEIITKDIAAERFQDQFEQNVVDLLGDNPLPESIIMYLNPANDLVKEWRETAEKIQKIQGVDEVVYEGELMETIMQFAHNAGLMVGIFGGGLLLVSFVFVILTIIGSINRREDFIRVIALSGGSPMMAKGPFIAMGGMYGLASGVIAVLVVEAIHWGVVYMWGSDYEVTRFWAPAIVCVGLALGVIAAGWAASKKIRLY